MKATYNDFLIENPMCGGFADNADAQAVFGILSEDGNIIMMVEASEQGRPALEPCIRILEDWFNKKNTCAIDLNDEFTRKSIGRMVKTIIAPFGYEVSSRKAISKQTEAEFFKTAACYKKSGTVRLKVVKKIVEA